MAKQPKQPLTPNNSYTIGALVKAIKHLTDNYSNKDTIEKSDGTTIKISKSGIDRAIDRLKNKLAESSVMYDKRRKKYQEAGLSKNDASIDKMIALGGKQNRLANTANKVGSALNNKWTKVGLASTAVGITGLRVGVQVGTAVNDFINKPGNEALKQGLEQAGDAIVKTMKTVFGFDMSTGWSIASGAAIGMGVLLAVGYGMKKWQEKQRDTVLKNINTKEELLDIEKEIKDQQKADEVDHVKPFVGQTAGEIASKLAENPHQLAEFEVRLNNNDPDILSLGDVILLKEAVKKAKGLIAEKESLEAERAIVRALAEEKSNEAVSHYVSTYDNLKKFQDAGFTKDTVDKYLTAKQEVDSFTFSESVTNHYDNPTAIDKIKKAAQAIASTLTPETKVSDTEIVNALKDQGITQPAAGAWPVGLMEDVRKYVAKLIPLNTEKSKLEGCITTYNEGIEKEEDKLKLDEVSGKFNQSVQDFDGAEKKLTSIMKKVPGAEKVKLNRDEVAKLATTYATAKVAALSDDAKFSGPNIVS